MIEEIKNFINNNKGLLLTIISIIFCGTINFIEYLTSNIYFTYYGISSQLYMYNDKNFIYGLFFSVLNIFLMISIMLCLKKVPLSLKNKSWLNFFKYLLIIFFGNAYLVIVFVKNLTQLTFWLNMSTFIFLEIIFTILIFRKLKKEENKDSNLFDLLIPIPLFIVFYIFIGIISTTSNIMTNKQYRIIGENKAIVYSNNNYSITLDCEIKDNTIILYKGTQQVIDNINVYSELKKYDAIKLQQKNDDENE